jgi:membrane protein
MVSLRRCYRRRGYLTIGSGLAHRLSVSAAVSLSWSELFTRTWREAWDDDVLGLAAQLSYYFFLALFPAILFLLAIASFFPLTSLTDDIGHSLGPFVSPQILELIQDQMRRLANSESGGLLTFGFVAALWSSSAALVSIVGALNRAYDIDESRPWWKVRLVAIGLTVGVALFVLCALSLVLVGPVLADSLGRATGWGAPFKWTWLVLQWPLAFGLVSTAIGVVYYFGPDADQDWAWISPGAIAATVLWFVVSLIFKFYISHFTDYNAAYGTVGGVIVLLLWFYVSGLAILTGAELNSEIEHASASGKARGEKSPQGRPVLGRPAERAPRGRLPHPPAATEQVESRSSLESHHRPTLGVVLLGGVLLGRLWYRTRRSSSTEVPKRPRTGNPVRDHRDIPLVPRLSGYEFWAQRSKSRAR